MTEPANWRHLQVELTDHPRFQRRIVRLTLVSSVALGALWGLAITTLHAPLWIDAAFAAGWVLMPATLVASIPRPRLRYGLVVPATLVLGGLLAVSAGWLPSDPGVAAGWLFLLAGVAFGGSLGLWFWYRVLPVPRTLDHPFSRPRWALIGAHVGLVVTGFALASQALWLP